MTFGRSVLYKEKHLNSQPNKTTVIRVIRYTNYSNMLKEAEATWVSFVSNCSEGAVLT